jgi:hypothetical protein
LAAGLALHAPDKTFLDGLARTRLEPKVWRACRVSWRDDPSFSKTPAFRAHWRSRMCKHRSCERSGGESRSVLKHAP